MVATDENQLWRPFFVLAFAGGDMFSQPSQAEFVYHYKNRLN